MNGAIASKQTAYKTFLHIFYREIHLAYIKNVAWMLSGQSRRNLSAI